MNSHPLERESLPITTRPGYTPNCLVFTGWENLLIFYNATLCHRLNGNLQLITSCLNEPVVNSLKYCSFSRIFFIMGLELTTFQLKICTPIEFKCNAYKNVNTNAWCRPSLIPTPYKWSVSKDFMRPFTFLRHQEEGLWQILTS